MRNDLIIGLNYNNDVVRSCCTPNWHKLFLAKSGGGKTYCMALLSAQLIAEGSSIVAIDAAGSPLPEAFADFLGARLRIYDASKGDTIPIAPFAIKPVCEDRQRCVNNMAQRIVDIFTKNLELSMPQQNVLYTACKGCAEMYDELTLEKIYEAVTLFFDEKGIGVSAKALYAKLTPLVENVKFSSVDDGAWNDILYGEATYTVIQLSSLAETHRKLVADILLNDLMDFIAVNGSMDKPFVCVIDEIQVINCSDGSPLSRLLRLSRKLGAGIWMATQSYPRSSNTVKIYEQAAETLIFPPTESDIKPIITKLLGGKQKKWQKLLIQLKPGMCVVCNANTAVNGKLERIASVFKLEDVIAKLQQASSSR